MYFERNKIERKFEVSLDIMQRIKQPSPISKLNDDCLISILGCLPLEDRLVAEKGIFVIKLYYARD